MKPLSFFFLCVFLYSCYTPNQMVWQESSSNPTPKDFPENMPSKPGSCYAKCMMPQLNEAIVLQKYPLFTGTDLDEGIELDSLVIITQEATTKWVKKKADRNCLSADPEDCLIWCLVEVPEVKETYLMVKDTSVTDLFEMKEITENRILKQGGYSEWKEILCDDKLSTNIVSDIQNFLASENLFEDTINGEFTESTRLALSQFQKNELLPLGHLDFETLDSMGINY